MIEYFSSAKAHSVEGVAVLRFTLRYPIIGIAPIDDFYSELVQNISKFAADRLFPALCEEYKCDPDPRRRFNFGYTYRLDCRVTSIDDEKVSLNSALSLRRKNSSAEVFSQKAEHTFRISDGCLLPPKYIKT